MVCILGLLLIRWRGQHGGNRLRVAKGAEDCTRIAKTNSLVQPAPCLFNLAKKSEYAKIPSGPAVPNPFDWVINLP